MRSAKWKVIVAMLEIAALVVIHAVMIRALAASGTVAVIFAAGPHAPKSALVAAGVFLLSRLILYLLLPGFVLARIGMAAVDHWTAGGDAEAESPAPGAHRAGADGPDSHAG